MSTATPEMTVTFNFDTFLEQMRGEWGPMSTPPKTVEEYIANEAMQQVVDSVRDEVKRSVEKTIAEFLESQVKPIAEEMVRERVEERMAKTFQPVDWSGEPKGPAVTINEIIKETIEREVKPRPLDHNNRRTGNETAFEKVISEKVRREMDVDFSGAIKEAREAVKAAVAKKSAELLSEAVITTALGKTR